MLAGLDCLAMHPGVFFSPQGGIPVGPVIHEILVTLDDQLANDLGAAVGIDDPKHALDLAQRQSKQQK